MGLFDSRPRSNYEWEKQMKYMQKAVASAEKQYLKMHKLYIDATLAYAKAAVERDEVKAELARLKEKYGEK